MRSLHGMLTGALAALVLLSTGADPLLAQRGEPMLTDDPSNSFPVIEKLVVRIFDSGVAELLGVARTGDPRGLSAIDVIVDERPALHLDLALKEVDFHERQIRVPLTRNTTAHTVAVKVTGANGRWAQSARNLLTPFLHIKPTILSRPPSPAPSPTQSTAPSPTESPAPSPAPSIEPSPGPTR